MNRVLTALALIAGAVYLIFFAPVPVFVGAALFVGGLCYWEFSHLILASGIQRPGLIGVAIGCAILFFPQSILPVSYVFLALQLILLLRRNDLRSIAPEAACTFLGAFYCFTPWYFAVELRERSVHLLFFALALNWVGDSAAFYFGRRFGKHKLAPSISPGKSWEGALASIAGSVVFGLLYLGRTMPQIPSLAVIGMAALGNIGGQCGDLAESAIKRGAGMKDSGSLLPGHGGVLDRLDSSMFAVPVVYALYIATIAYLNS